MPASPTALILESTRRIETNLEQVRKDVAELREKQVGTTARISATDVRMDQHEYNDLAKWRQVAAHERKINAIYIVLAALIIADIIQSFLLVIAIRSLLSTI